MWNTLKNTPDLKCNLLHKNVKQEIFPWKCATLHTFKEWRHSTLRTKTYVWKIMSTHGVLSGMAVSTFIGVVVTPPPTERATAVVTKFKFQVSNASLFLSPN